MARMTSPSRRPVALLTEGEILKMSTPSSLRIPRSARIEGVTVMSSRSSRRVYFSAVTVGRSPVTTRRCTVRRPLRTERSTASPTWRSSFTASQSR